MSDIQNKNKKMKKQFLFLILATCFAFTSCNIKEQAKTTPAKTETKSVFVPQFNTDSAMAFLKKQCEFGPRVPNTAAHDKCGQYMIDELKRMGATVKEQDAELTAFDKTKLKSKNIIASYNTENNNRVAFFAHWDCRPFSDADQDQKNTKKPVEGANDGASGVAILMELARLMQGNNPGIGVDLVLFDCEDYGAPYWAKEPENETTWCLGSQYWSKNTGYTAENKPKWGILLDMVGAPDAQFAIDYYSYYFATSLGDEVWKMAKDMGFGSTFAMTQGGNIVDDHVFVNQNAKIPTIDIIDYKQGYGFPESWHTQHDDVEHIDKNTIGMVGRVITKYLYTYASNQ